MTIELTDRFSKTKTIPGILKYRLFTPNLKRNLKRFSYAEESNVFSKPKLLEIKKVLQKER